MKLLQKESGVTLIEVLATLTIMAIIGSVVYSVFFQTINAKEKSQSHNELRQEANLVVTQLRSMHQRGETVWYDAHHLYEDEQLQHLIASESYSFEKRNSVLNEESGKTELNPNQTYEIAFTITDAQGNRYELATTLLGRSAVKIESEIVKPEDGGGSEPEKDFYTIIKEENVFVYGSRFSFSGSKVEGPNATMVIKGDINGSDLNGGSFSNVSNIYVGGSLKIEGGSAGLGSQSKPGVIYVDGDLFFWGGTRHIYGDVYVNGDFKLRDATIHGNVYVLGNVELGWGAPQLVGNSKVYYKGTLTYPRDGYPADLLNKMVHSPNLTNIIMPDYGMPRLREEQWYIDHGYNQTVKQNGMKIYGNNIVINQSSLGEYMPNYTNAIVVSTGDITLNDWITMTGVLFAPNGKVTFNGASFEGLVIARDGFHVKSGGSTVIFKGIEHYISNSDEFPLQ